MIGHWARGLCTDTGRSPRKSIPQERVDPSMGPELNGSKGDAPIDNDKATSLRFRQRSWLPDCEVTQGFCRVCHCVVAVMHRMPETLPPASFFCSSFHAQTTLLREANPM